MDKKENIRTACGEITVFLSMIFLLILALVGTALESARINVGRSYVDRSLQNAMDSLFTEYCIPLWEDYHLFLLEGEATEEEDENYIRNTLYGYMEYTFGCQKGEEGSGDYDKRLPNSMDLLNMELKQLAITNVVRADDYGGELLLHQILEYEKYQVDGEFLREEKEAAASIEEVNACMAVAEKQLEAEQKMAEVNMEVLEFMSAVEGISVGKNGIKRKWNGRLQTEKYFVKQFCPVSINQTSVGINHSMVWESLKSRYVNPISQIEKLQQEARKILVQIARAEAQREAGEEEDDINYEKLYRLENKLVKNAEGVLEEIEEAQEILSEIKKKQGIFAEEAKNFEAVYQAEEGRLSGEQRRAFKEELEKLKSFAGMESEEDTSVIAGILKMEPYLESNAELAEELCGIKYLSVGSSVEEAEAYIEEIDRLKEGMRDYQIREMTFDYSSLITKKETGNPMEAFSKGYKSNLLELVAEDVSELSRKAKKSQRQMEKVENSAEKAFLGSSLKKSETEGYSVEVQAGIRQFNALYDGVGWIREEADRQLQKILLSRYVEQHFKSYAKQGEVLEEKAEKRQETNGEEYQEGEGRLQKEDNLQRENKLQKETVLDYEEEYILFGKLTDKENLEAAAERIIFFRTILNYTYLLTDKEKTEAAYCTAAALVGYSCMEPLVQLTKNLILLIWAMEEGIVDTAALMQGKEMPVFKTKETFQVTFEELLLFGRDLVQKKLQDVSWGTDGTTMDYKQYLRMFLNFSSKEQKLNGIMDLMEDNIKLRYDKDFSLENCIYGIEAETSFFMEEKFMSFPFVQKLLRTEGKGFQIDSHQSYCY